MTDALDLMVHAALKYAEVGFPVFPCRARRKRPLTRHGLKDASRDPATINSWWGQTPDANIGIPMGPPSGLFALDVDGPEGEASLAALEQEHGPLPVTLEQKTGRGRHLLFRYPQNGTTIPNSASKLGTGLDIRGDGGYIIVAPSVHSNARSYQWREGHCPTDKEPAEAPSWLLDLVVRKPPPVTTERPEQEFDQDAGPYAEAALKREVQAVSTAPEGQRNDRLNIAAYNLGQLVAGGALPAERVEAELTGAAHQAGLEADEARRTISSGLSAGAARPREVPVSVSLDTRHVTRESPDDKTQAAIVEAEEAVADLVERAETDKGAPFEPEALKAMSIIRAHEPASFQRLRDNLKRAGIPMRDLNAELRINNLRVIEGGAAGGDGATVQAGPYKIVNGAICHQKATGDGPVVMPLCNFDARIVGEEIRDDGVEQATFFSVEGTLQGGKRLPTADVPAERYSSMSWVTANWGTGPVVYAGQGTKDHVRAAIQLLSGEVPRRTVFTHLGWRKIGEKWAYLHADGAIGPNGPIPEVQVQTTDTRLTCYALPEPPVDEKLKAAVRASLSTLELGPAMITYPLVAAIYRAPLGEVAVLDLSLIVAGPTGSQKTEVTAIAQAHYGAEFHAKNLPGNWVTTANTLEKQAFLVKDAIFTVDDFAPTGTTADVQRLHRDADRLLRGQGNRAGRGRMRADGSIRPVYYPRGIIVSSGEDIPRGQSLRARMVILELSQDQIDLELLTKAQDAANQGLYSQSMAGYVQWLAPQIDSLKTDVPERLRELRAEARQRPVSHDRTPDIVASLALGWETFLRFAREVDAITDEKRAALQDKGWQILLAAAEAQVGYQADEEPASRFLTLLGSAIASGQAHIADAATNERPQRPGNWGWRERKIVVSGNEQVEHHPKGNLVGWLSGEDVYLDPDAAFAAAQRLARDQGGGLSITPKTLWKRLAEQRKLASSDTARKRNVVRRNVGDQRRSVIHIHADTLLCTKSGPMGPSGPQPNDLEVPWAENGGRFFDDVEKTALETGPEVQENSDPGPDGPLGPQMEHEGE